MSNCPKRKRGRPTTGEAPATPSFRKKYSYKSYVIDDFRLYLDLNNNSNTPPVRCTPYRLKRRDTQQEVTLYGDWRGTNKPLCLANIRTWRKLAKELGIQAGTVLSTCGSILHVQLIIKGGPNAPWATDPLNPDAPPFTLGWKATIYGKGPKNEFHLGTDILYPTIKEK